MRKTRKTAAVLALYAVLMLSSASVVSADQVNDKTFAREQTNEQTDTSKDNSAQTTEASTTEATTEKKTEAKPTTEKKDKTNTSHKKKATTKKTERNTIKKHKKKKKDIISSLTGKWVTPVDTTVWAYKHGYYTSAGASHEMVPALAKQYKLSCNGLGTDINKVRSALKKKHPVVALMGPGYFTKKGHFIVLVAIDNNDQVTVADVGSRERTQYKYLLKDVVAQTKAASAGGPCWEIYSKDKKAKKTTDTKTKTIQAKKEFKDTSKMYAEIKAVLQKNYHLSVPLKKVTLVNKDQFVTVSSLTINDKVTVMDVSKKLTVKGSFWNTVTIEPNKTSVTE